MLNIQYFYLTQWIIPPFIDVFFILLPISTIFLINELTKIMEIMRLMLPRQGHFSAAKGQTNSLVELRLLF